jgi:hypothetical protein
MAAARVMARRECRRMDEPVKNEISATSPLIKQRTIATWKLKQKAE